MCTIPMDKTDALLPQLRMVCMRQHLTSLFCVVFTEKAADSKQCIVIIA